MVSGIFVKESPWHFLEYFKNITAGLNFTKLNYDFNS